MVTNNLIKGRGEVNGGTAQGAALGDTKSMGEQAPPHPPEQRLRSLAAQVHEHPLQEREIARKAPQKSDMPSSLFVFSLLWSSPSGRQCGGGGGGGYLILVQAQLQFRPCKWVVRKGGRIKTRAPFGHTSVPPPPQIRCWNSWGMPGRSLTPMRSVRPIVRLSQCLGNPKSKQTLLHTTGDKRKTQFSDRYIIKGLVPFTHRCAGTHHKVSGSG